MSVILKEINTEATLEIMESKTPKTLHVDSYN